VTGPPLAAALICLLLPGIAVAGERFDGWDFYFGDLHVHSGASLDGMSSDMERVCPEVDGVQQPCGAVAELIANAQTQGLDFLAVTDHANGEKAAASEDFEQVLAVVMDGHDEAGGFLTVPAAEIWMEDDGKLGGHTNLYLFADNDELFDLVMDDFVPHDDDGEPTADFGSCGALWRWITGLEEDLGPLLLLPHHPQMSGAMGTNWACYSHVYPEARRFSPAVEIYSRHGNNRVLPASYDPLWSADVESFHDLAEALHPKGWDLPLGVLASTDAHNTLPGAVCQNDSAYRQQPYGGGLAALALPADADWTRGAIHEAILERRSYATSGVMLPALIEYSADGAVLGGMGEVLAVPPEATVTVRLAIPPEHEPAVLTAILVTPDEELSLEPLGDGAFGLELAPGEQPAWAYGMVVLDGERWYGEDGCDDGGSNSEERVWLSPSWFGSASAGDSDTGTPTDDGCGGCATGAPSSGSVTALTLLASLLGWRRRR